MNLLFLCHRIPYPPDKGDKVRSFHWVRHLAERHAVHLACLADERRDLDHVGTLRRLCASVDVVYRSRLRAKCLAGTWALSGSPLSVRSFLSAPLKRRIDRMLATLPIDRIVVYSSSMAEYVRGVRSIPKVIDLVDVDSEKWLELARIAPFPSRLIYEREGRRLRRYERDLGHDFERCVLVSPEEEALYRTVAPHARTTSIPNGVDASYFRAHGDGGSDRRRDGGPVVVFTGAMDYAPNVDAVRYFCGEIFPLVLAQRRDARLLVVGRNPDRAVRRLADDPRVVVTGAVPDVRPFMARASVAVAPMRVARGVQNKILEAMAMGLPVVTTSKGLEGLDLEPGRDLFVHDGPAGFAARVVELLADDGLRARVGGRARAAALAYDWQRSAGLLEALLDGAGEEASPSPRPAPPAGAAAGAVGGRA